MADGDDIIHFAEEQKAPSRDVAPPWKVAVIDDDRAVHEGTRYALYDYRLNGQGLVLLSAYSAAEGKDLLRANPDIAVVLLDVVMETDSAGLDLVTFIRNELNNDTLRIILRTGQPGQAPERHVIVDYDINDYKAKTELTADKLFTAVTAALRSHQQLLRMAQTRRGLEIILDAATTLFDFRSMQKLAEGVLTQLASLIAVSCAGILVLRDNGPRNFFRVIAGSGCYSDFIGLREPEQLDPELLQLILQAFERRRTEFLENRSVLYLSTASGSEIVVLLEAAKDLTPTDRTLVEIFCGRLTIAFDNVVLYDQLQQANATLERRVDQRTAQLRAANARLQAQWMRERRANAFKSEILGTVAHDIKSPLGVILGRTEIISELLANNTMPLPQIETQVGHIQQSGKQLAGMVDELISDALADAHDISLRLEPIDLPGLVREVIDANLPSAERKAQIINVGGDDRVVVVCDPDRMREAFDNLISNAIKYSPMSGMIEVDVRAASDEAIFSVSDQGPGLAPDDMRRLFGRFQRLSAKPTAGEGSTGLGLSIAKRIVELHDGSIRAESRGPGLGSTFTIALKLAESAAS
jgi:signal transduction histidine kinase